VIHDVVHVPLDTMWHFIQLELWIWILIANIHVNNYEKMTWQMKLQGLMVSIFFLMF
jgi:hypothetical protein